MTKMMELTKTMETFLGGVTLDAKNVPHFSSAARKAMDEIADFAEETNRAGEQPEEYAPVKDIYRQMMEGIQEAVCEEDRDAICLEKMAELRGAVVDKQKLW